ncbi:tyrosine-type recombinase/integrase [Chitinophaga rhizosphaerae]|uniref:tyrosine-type recombinase/integrase n=1 Tax=Chitinophaga rhizosphaerae TaxID=1864947 RepID=UPI000F809AA2|nr:tyrosine-type recombinase/integrase [Chitinophaga rhizosphaerae]
MLKPGYSDPQLHRYNGDLSKEWYVDFYFTCQARQRRKRVPVRLGINYFSTVKERDREGRAAVKIITESLEAGWNPFDCKIEAWLLSHQESEPAPEPIHEMKTPDGVPVPTPATLFPDAIQLAYQIRQKELKKKSRFNYETGLRYAIPAIKAGGMDKLPLEKVKRVHVRMLLEQIGKLRQAEYDKEGKGKVWTPNAFNRYKSYISAYFDALLEWEAVEFNPCLKIDDKEPIDFGIHRHATDEELKMLKAELPKYHQELYNLVRFEHVTGMRPNEILQYRYNMTDWLNSEIKLSYLEGKTRIYRVVPVPAFMLKWIRERQGDHPASNYAFGRKLRSGPKSLTANNLSRLWKKYVKDELGLNISLYSFKGLGGDAKRDAGVSYSGVQASYGHALGSSSTKPYLRKEGERLRQQIKESMVDL